MSDAPCPNCGNRNPPTIQFCATCGTYLGWIDEKTGLISTDPRPGGSSTPRGTTGPGASTVVADPTAVNGVGGPTVRTREAQQPWGVPTGQYGWEPVRPAPPGGGGAGHQQGGPGYPSGGPDVDSDLRAELEQTEVVVVTPGAPPSPVTVHIANTSTVVEAYRVSAVGAPPWLNVTVDEARLLPGTDERVQVRLAIAADKLVPVQRFRLTLRVQGESSQRLSRDVYVNAEVGAIVAPAQIRLEPSNVRVKDETSAGLRVFIDNQHSNVPMTFDLSARDPEQEVRFAFQPARLTVPPGGHGMAQLWFQAPLPNPGEQLNRTLTITAKSSDQELSANAGFHQSASALVVDPPIVLRMDPSVVHADRRVGVTHIVLDNRRGSRPQRIHLEARDVENGVRFVIEPQDLEVPAGQYAMAKLTMRAPRPRAGESKTRSLVISAWNGQQSVETQGQLVQEAAARRPFMRVLLVLLGGLAMLLGSFLPWTTSPRGSGVQWNHPNVPNFLLGVDTSPVDNVLAQLGIQELVSAFVSVGGFTVLFGLLAMLGLFGTGKLIRTSAVFGIIVMLLFLGACIASLFIGSGYPGIDWGWGVVLAGCVLALVGSHFPKP